MSTLVEKPPKFVDSPGSSPQITRRRKVNRVPPVPKRRQSSPARIRRLSELNLSSEDEADEKNPGKKNLEKMVTSSLSCSNTNENIHEFKKMERPKNLPVVDTHESVSLTSPQHVNLLSEETVPEGKKIAYLFKRRNTERPNSRKLLVAGSNCSCRSHRGSLGSCGCKNSRRRHTLSPNVTIREVMEKEAKLLVLDFLSSLPPEKLTARHKSSPKESNERAASLNESELTKNPRQGSKKGLKSHTVTFGEDESKHLMKQIAEHAKLQEQKSKKLTRSASAIYPHEEKFSHTFQKLEEMKIPIQKWMELNITDSYSATSQSYEKPQQSPKKNSLRLTIPRRSLQQVGRSQSIYTPETNVVNRLEEISQDIMERFPCLLNEAIDEILEPLHEDKSITYDLFSKTAQTVYDNKLSNVSGTVWSRVALVLYMVKETVYSGNLNDKQVELLVEHSTKFMTENVTKTVRKEGGWDAVQLDDWMVHSNILARDDMSSDEDFTDHGKESEPITAQLRDKVSEWSPYGMAALAVGLGLAYSYLKT